MAKTPSTIEEMIAAITVLLEKYPTGLVPYEDSIIPTHRIFLDICTRIKRLEEDK